MKRILWIAFAVGAVALGEPADPVATCTLRWLSAAEFSPAGGYLAVGTHDAVVLYGTENWEEVMRLPFPGVSVSSLAFSLNGERLAAGALNEVRVWEVATGQILATIHGSFGRVRGMAFGPEGSLLIGGSDGSLSQWEMGQDDPLWTMTPHAVPVQEVEFSRDGMLMSSAGHDRAILWDTATWTELRSLPGKAWDVAFTPDGYFLVVGWGKILRVWDTAVGLLYHNELWGHESCSIAVAVSPDGRFLLSGSLDETARVWDAETGECLAVLAGHGAVVPAVGFSPDGSLIMTASNNGVVRIWSLAQVLAQP